MKDIAKFIAGFERFQAKYFREERGLFSRLRQGQQPRALVIACCDSRVGSSTLALHGWYFDIDDGELLAYSAETATFGPLVSEPVPNQDTGV